MIDPKTHELDPVYLHSLREAKLILLIFALFAVGVLGLAFLLGNRDNSQPESGISLMMGIPSWVFWSIGLPWLVANLVTGWFCLVFMSKDPLEEQPHLAVSATQESTPAPDDLPQPGSSDASRGGRDHHE